MILHSKPTCWDEKGGYYDGRGKMTIGPPKDKDKDKEKEKEFFSEEEFKV